MGGNKKKLNYRFDYKIVFVAPAEPGQLAGNPSIHSGATIVTFCKLAIPANTSLANPLAVERKANRGHLAGFYDRAGKVPVRPTTPQMVDAADTDGLLIPNRAYDCGGRPHNTLQPSIRSAPEDRSPIKITTMICFEAQL